MTQHFLLSKRLRLRPLNGGDAPQFVRLFGGDSESLNMLKGLPQPMTLESIRPWIERTSAKSGRFGVTRRSDGEFMGFIGWSLVDGDILIGYLIGREYRKRGYAAEAVGLIAEKIRTLGHSRIMAETLPQNPASIRVLEKCGFTYSGAIRAESERKGEIMEFWLYKLDL